MHVHAVVAKRISQHTRRTAGRGGNANAGVQNVVVDFLCPVAIAQRRRQPLGVTRPAPCLTREHSAAPHVVVGHADRLHPAAGQPHRHVPPKRFLDIDPHAGVLPEGLLDVHHRRRHFAGGFRDVNGARHPVKQERAPFPLVLPGLRVPVRLPVVAAIPPSDDRREVQILRLHQ